MNDRQALRSHAEKCMDESELPYYIAFGQPSDLAFSDRMHCLVTLDRPPGSLGRSKTQARCDALLDEAVVLFDDVV